MTVEGEPEALILGNDILEICQSDTWLGSVLGQVYIEEVREYLNKQLCAVLDQIFCELKGCSQFELAKKYIEMLTMLSEQLRMYSRGIHDVPLSDHE